MSVVCGQCSRVNPPDAAYCYFDGAALAGRAGGPINAGSAPFPHQFVFPSGLACRNFDQLAMACQQNWADAINLLKQGYLGSFFGGMGRVDLATAAADAAKFPDLDRGLDQLLAKLPTQSLEAPKLQAEPSEINLGQIKIGENRASELHLTNLGMRLLYGTVTSDCKWLTLGDGAGHAEKMFQFGGELTVPVQVRGQHLRAGTKPVEGKLVIDSNGGATTVTFRADVPVTAYPGGMFQGAITPRQVAEKAKAAPKEAAPYFERGEVAQWYASNGWDYPVRGPIMPSVGAIQQFFEALGVAKSPRVEFNPKALDVQGFVGTTVEAKIEVSTPDRKVVYGWATCDAPWVEVGKTRLTGKTATIPITIKIPNPCPPNLEAVVNVVGNGSQKLAVPLKVAVAGGKEGVKLEAPEEYVTLEVLEDDSPAPAESIAAAPPPPAPFAFEDAPAPAAPAAPPPTGVLFALPAAPAEPPPAEPATVASAPRPSFARMGPHLIPVAILAVCLLVLLVRDIFAPAHSNAGAAVEDDGQIDSRQYVVVRFDEGRQDKDYTDSMNFAVHKVDPVDKNAPSVRLNWYPNGAGNSIVAKIDGKEAIFGAVPGAGRWDKGFETHGKPAGAHGGKTRTFDFTKEGIFVTQTVTIEPGDPVQTATGEFKRLLNMCLIRYTIENRDNRQHNVGLRILMDTCIGDEDGVPFTLPGVKQLVDTSKDFRGADVPDFIQVLEKRDLANPGIVLQMNLRINDKLEPPSRFLLTRYPGKEGNRFAKWDIPVRDMEGDSCVVIYWEPKPLKKHDTREVGFTYGVGNITGTNKLAVTVGGAMHIGGELTVVGLIADMGAKSATLNLKDGLELIDPKTKTQPVPATRTDESGKVRPIPVTWRVRATTAGRHDVNVSTDNGLSQTRRVAIGLKALFN